jgi:hypothetical protein
MKTAYDRRTIAGAILVAIGLAFLATEWFALGDAFVIGSIAAVFVVAYALTRRYGFLVPGMILAGAAVGTGLQDYGYDPSGGLVAIAIGAGFLAIYLVDAAARDASRWWPLIPGTILMLFGLSEVTEGTAAARLIEQLWPLVLILAGVGVLFGASRRSSAPGPMAQ